jgi:CheY-like chemotaxis protein
MSAEQGGGGETSPAGVRVLVVDDDERICRQMAAGLAAAGYQVVTAHDGSGEPAATHSPTHGTSQPG